MRFTMMILLAAELHAQCEHTVTVYVRGLAVVPGPVLYEAQKVADQILSSADVRIDWRRGAPTGLLVPGEKMIIVDMAAAAPKRLSPVALAEALPYERVHITVFYDRVRKVTDRVAPARLLAHVMVHEITHILQGIDRHSESGIMKAHWRREDYTAMARSPLPFTSTDIALIHDGMAK